MTKVISIALLCLSIGAGSALAEETAGEKVDKAASGTSRELKKAGNRVSEAACTGTPAECEAEKARHHAREAKDRTKDKVKEVKDKVD